MSRTGITFEAVKKAIAELQGRQKNPTVDNIREILGTGSKSTIARFLREWKSQHGLQSNDDGRLPSDLLGVVHGLWDALCSKADRQVDGYRQESNTKFAQMQQQLLQSKQVEANLRQSIHALEEQLHQQKEVAQQLKTRLLKEEQDKIRLIERAAALHSRRQEHQAENQQLHQLLKHVQDNLEHYQAATQKLREEQSLLIEKKQNEYEQRLSSLMSQVNTATEEKSAYQIQYNQLTKIHESLIVERNLLENQNNKIQVQYESIKVVYDKLKNDYDELEKQNHTQTTELAAIPHTVIELQLKLKYKDEEMASLQEKLVKASDKIETLRNESQFILQEKAGLQGQLKQMQILLPSSKMKAVG